MDFPKLYVDKLAMDAAIMRQYSLRFLPDSFFVLGYAYYMQLITQGEEYRCRRRLTQRSRDLCSKAVADGDLLELEKFQEMVAQYVSPATVHKWYMRKRLVVHRISGGHRPLRLMPTNLAERLAFILSLPRLLEAAALMHTATATLKRQIAEGLHKTYTDPGDGGLRVVVPAIVVPELSVTPAELADTLGVTLDWVNRRIWDGRIPSTGQYDKRRIPVNEIERQRVALNTLNPGFEWLQRNIERSEREPELLWGEEAVKKLVIERSVLSVWALADLVPYYETGRGLSGQVNRRYVKQYIEALARALRVADQTTFRAAATQYKQRCAEAQQIL